jgi:hypothetical protein
MLQEKSSDRYDFRKNFDCIARPGLSRYIDTCSELLGDAFDVERRRGYEKGYVRGLWGMLKSVQGDFRDYGIVPIGHPETFLWTPETATALAAQFEADCTDAERRAILDPRSVRPFGGGEAYDRHMAQDALGRFKEADRDRWGDEAIATFLPLAKALRGGVDDDPAFDLKTELLAQRFVRKFVKAKKGGTSLNVDAFFDDFKRTFLDREDDAQKRLARAEQRFLAEANTTRWMAEDMVMEQVLGTDTLGPEYDDVVLSDLPNWPAWGTEAVAEAMAAARRAYARDGVTVGEINDAVQDAIRVTAERWPRSNVIAFNHGSENLQRLGIVPAGEDLPIISAATFAGKPVPERDWSVPGLVPGKAVTLLSGDGGVGKSTLIAQLAVMAPVGGTWIGTQPKRGPVVFVSAEDSLDENHRRLADIAASQGIELADLSDLHIVPLAGRDAVMGAPHVKGGRLVDTAVWRGLVRIVKRVKPVLVILDTLADVFGGNEIVRAEARQFISQLSGLAIDNDLAVILLAHPSLTGINSGTGTSGSTAWSNSVRSRLYFNRAKDQYGEELDPTARVLRPWERSSSPGVC